MTIRAFMFLAALGACGITGRYMPHDIKGETPLMVENAYGDDVCTMLVAPATAKDQNQYNLLYSTMRGVIPLKGGEKATFHVKPGAYAVYIESCQRGFEAEQTLTLSGPTYVSIGRGGAAPAGYAAVTLTSGPLTSCILTGTMNDGRPCCSGRHHYDTDVHDEVCEEP